MKFNSFLILLIILLSIILSSLSLDSVLGQNPQCSIADTGLIDALPQKPIVNAKALENAMKKIENKKNGKTYDLVLFTAITLVLYYLTLFLSKINIIERYTHRKIWNIILLLMAIIAVLGGFLATVQLKYDIMMNWYKEILFWHVEAGISMTFIAIFHIWWHRKYFINILKKAKE